MTLSRVAAGVLDIAAFAIPDRPEVERRLWYQYYLHGERGRAGLAAHRREYTRTLWREWSPTWQFGDDDFETSATSFDNPDFVDVVVHSYRHRYGLVAGDARYEATEVLVAAQPVVAVPTIVLDPTEDTIGPATSRAAHEPHFSDLRDYRQLAAGHNVPQEVPQAFARAVLDLHHR